MRRVVGFALATSSLIIASVCGTGPAAARGVQPNAGCDTWKSAVSGNWNDPSKWSSGVPDDTTAVCINLAGAYTVSVTDYETADSVSLGAASGTQPTLTLSTSQAGSDAELDVAEDITNSATITTTSTGSGNPGYYSDLIAGGTITNSGTISTNLGTSHGYAYLEASIVNTGTVSINGPTYYDASPTEFDNSGTFTVAAAQTFIVSGESEFVDSGTVTNNGTFAVSADTAFTLTSGTVSGSPITLQGGNANDDGTGAASFEFTQGGTFTGNVASGQTLTVASVTGNNNTDVFVPQSFSNAGTIVVTSIGNTHSSSQESSLYWNGTLTNSATGSITLSAGAVSDYRYLNGNLVNSGLVDVQAPLGYYAPSGTSGGQFTNHKTLTVESGGGLVINQATLVNGSQGVVTATGSVVLNDSVFEEQQGRTTGGSVELTNSSELALEGTGASKFVFTSSGQLSGNIAASQTVTIAGITATNSTYVQAMTSFTNAGTLVLTSQGASSGAAQDAELDWSGRLTNTGTISATAGASGGNRYLEGPFLDNSGTVSATVTLTDTNSNSRWTNSGTVKVSAGRQLALTNGTYVQTAAGTFATTVNATKAGAIVPSVRALLDGALTVTGTPTSGHSYTVLGPTNVYSGTFASVTAGYTPNYLAIKVTITAA